MAGVVTVMVLKEEVEDPEEEEIMVEEVVIPDLEETNLSLKPLMDPYSSSLVMALGLNTTQTLNTLITYLPSLLANRRTC